MTPYLTDATVSLLQSIIAAYDKDRGDGRPLFIPPGDDRSDDLRCDFWTIAGRARFILREMGHPEIAAD